MKIFAVIIVGLALSTSPVQAQAARTFVSPTGSDSANCSLATPCRTFVAAYAVTNAGGEISVLGTAGYGPLTISKAISIVNGGGFEAAIAVPSSAIGITINAGVADAISLRGLTIEGGGVGDVGIQFNSGASLTVENCVIRRVNVNGISFFSTGASSLSVSNSLMTNVGFHGINVNPSGSSAVTAVFNRVQTNNNGDSGIAVNGLGSTGTVKAAVYDSVASGNGGGGFFATTTSGKAPTTLMLFHSVSSNNAIGLRVSGSGATLRIAHSMVTLNAAGWTVASSGALSSDGDNTIEGNTGSETAPTTYTRK